MKPQLPEEEKLGAVERGDDAREHHASHHHRQFEVMGAHTTERGAWFTVWAPNARDAASASPRCTHSTRTTDPEGAPHARH